MSWGAMISRCYNQNNHRYPEYGGRGIVVCERWKNSFENFLEDMGERPDGMTLDRIDVNGNYCKDNCRWATDSLQSFNMRKRKDNTSGKTGVYWEKRRGRWVASIDRNGETIYLGSYPAFEDAVKAREEAELKYFYMIKE